MEWNLKILFGCYKIKEWKGMEWNGFSRERNGMEWNLKILLRCYKIKEWKGMECK